MNNPVATIANALQRDGGEGIVVIYYPDIGTRDWLVDEVESIASVEGAVRTNLVADAHRHPNNLVLLTPVNEQAAVEELDGIRDHFLEPRRTQPVVLFLLREGDGSRALRDAPSLASWVRGSDPDPEKLAEIDLDEERRTFKLETSMVPEDWLDRWRAGSIAKDAKSIRLSYRAALLEKR